MKNTTLTLLATTILSATALQAYAAAPKEPEAQFYPAKSWIVGNGATPAECVVQSEFNNGFVLRFDGTQDWVQSFSVNFRQNIFMADNKYNVTLSVPGKASKQFSAAATDMTTLSLRVDKDIYQNVRENSVLDVTIDDNVFRFFLVNFATAASKFEACMSGGDMGDGTAPPAVAAEPQHVSAPEQLQAPEAPAPVQREANNTIEQEEIAPPPQQREAKNTAPQPALQKEIAPPPSREVNDSIPQGNIAPPPPNARDVDAIASLNESIALEERETSGKNVPITEIRPEDPKPTMQRIPYTETVKVGDAIIEKKEVTPPPAAAASPAPYRKRMSEQLAEEMATNPSTSSILEGGNQRVTSAPVETADADPLAPVDMQEPMAVPPTIEEVASPPPAAQEEPEEAPPQIIAWSSPPPSPPASAAPKPPPAPVEAAPAPAPAPIAAAPAPQPAPAAPTSIKTITPEQARAMAAAQQAGQPVGLIQSTAQPTASLKPIAPAKQPLQQDIAVHNPAPQPIPQEETLLQADLAPVPSTLPASPDEPFAQRGEIIKTDAPKREKIVSADPVMLPPAETDSLLPRPETKRLQSPEIKVNKQTYQAKADFTDAEPFAGEPFRGVQQQGEPAVRRKADPEMLMKISQLEQKINELEKENGALQNNVSSDKAEAVSIETDNWNLERATARYNEAERQIKRMGEQLQRERALRASEKKDLEAQLFDPQITEQQQLARLAELEQKLAEAEGRLEQQRIRYEERLRGQQAPGARAAQ